jgi:DNA-directed RNA polymerase subunit M/transcription elongation factor TFIIS
MLALLSTVTLQRHAVGMPDSMNRPLWTEQFSSSRTPSPPAERFVRKQAALAKGAKKALARGKYKADSLKLPQHWVRGDDPDHTAMRVPVDPEDAHTLNIMPENAMWKDHDSDQDEGHPNWKVERLLDMDSQEMSQDMDRNMEEAGFDITRWTDENYAATIEKYNLQDISKAKHLCPKLYFEPPGSSEEDVFAQMLADDRGLGPKVPSMQEPFCMSCEALLGAPLPEQGLYTEDDDPRCRQCGFMNPHGPDGTLLTHAQVNMVELEPSKLVHDEQQAAGERYLASVDETLREAVTPNLRPTTQQRCEECGWNEAYYWAAQVRGADEGQTAFFECVRCQNVWTVK